MKAVGGELFRQPVLARRSIENRIGRVGRRGEKERQQHDAGFAAAAPPGPEEQHADQRAEDDFSSDREDLVKLSQVQSDTNRQKQNTRSERCGRARRDWLAVKRSTNSSVTAMKMRPLNMREDAVDREWHPVPDRMRRLPRRRRRRRDRAGRARGIPNDGAAQGKEPLPAAATHRKRNVRTSARDHVLVPLAADAMASRSAISSRVPSSTLSRRPRRIGTVGPAQVRMAETRAVGVRAWRAER